MSSKSIVADGLWRCLCPSYQRAWPRRTQLSWPLKQPANSTRSAVRSLSTATTTSPSIELLLDGRSNELDPAPEPERKAPKKPLGRPAEFRTTGFWKHLRMPKSRKGLGLLSEAAVDQMIRESDENAPNFKETFVWLRELVWWRAREPKQWHYRALIAANADANFGSPVNVRKLLEEMEENSIPLDSATLHATLKALAIHPDYLLRQEILHTLRDRWLPLSQEGWHNVVTGLIREGQLEMAMDHISRMETQNIPVNDWLYSLLIYNLCDAGEFDAVLEIMQKRVAGGHELSPILCSQVFNAASEAFHENIVTYVWKRLVKTGLLNPSYGVCTNILRMTTRTGNSELALEVFKVLEERNGNVLLEDYNCLIDTFVAAGDVESALRVLCTAQKATFQLDETATRSLFAHLVQKQTAVPRKLWALLRRLKSEEQLEIPLVAANVVVELATYKQSMTVAMEIYNDMKNICPQGPSVITFNHLIAGCRTTRAYDLAKFYVQEMIMLDVFPNRMTYDHLILLCVDAERFHEAHQYLVEMARSGFALREASKTKISAACRYSEDPDARALAFDAGVRKPIARGPISYYPV
ncbi:hypothetical protein FQN51_000822 [Onygenales sp. PD_10]|nr:hypothetical protein FQN51_000822 [Onygenales sp. PD_10]